MGLNAWNDGGFGIEAYCFFSIIGLILNEVFFIPDTGSSVGNIVFDVPKLYDLL